MTKLNNPPAFPRTGFEADTHQSMSTDTQPQEGMTLRDYFACGALDGIISNAKSYGHFGNAVDENKITTIAHYTRMAYEYADAMLAERMKNEQ